MTDSEHIIDLLHKGIIYGEKLGAKSVELRYDNLLLTTINVTNNQIKEASTKQRKGIGVMAYYNGTEGSSFTPNLKLKDIKEAVERAFGVAKSSAERNKLKLPFSERDPIKDKIEYKVKKHPKDIEFAEKLALINRGLQSINEHVDPRSTTGMYGELYGWKYFVNSDGSEIIWNPLIVDMRIQSIGVNEEGRQAVGSDSRGANAGLEFYEKENNHPEVFGANAGKWCKEQMEAKAVKSGKYRSLVGPRLTGVLAHESFGHLSESDFVITGMSPLADQLGEQLGSEHATIIDEGAPEIEGALYLPYDDQGTATRKTVLLDKGILKGYLHNRGTAAKMNSEPTGNARAIHFMYNPIPRMKNTYFIPGELSKEEALEQLGTGIYAIASSGGQVGLDGNFLFQCSRGYFVENGEIQYPIRDASLSGNILNFIKQIEACTKTFKLYTGYFGGCGKGGQFPLPVGLGGPETLVKEVLIGGN